MALWRQGVPDGESRMNDESISGTHVDAADNEEIRAGIPS